MSTREVFEGMDSVPNGRLLAISALLRMGWPVANVSRALKLADKGDIDGAMSALQRKTDYHISGATEEDA